MPRYRFTHPWPEIFADLQHDVNAIVHHADHSGDAPAGSTVALSPGDEIETPTEYAHPHLQVVSEQLSDAATRLGHPEPAALPPGESAEPASEPPVTANPAS